MMRSLLALASPAGLRGRLSVLIFHRVHARRDELFPDELDARDFEQLLGWVVRWFDVMPLDEAAARLRQGSLPACAAALSFDDGYRDNHDVALPVLQRLGLPCTFFIATGFLDGGRMWNDTVIETLRRTRLAELPADDLMPGLGTLPCATTAQRREALERVIGRIKYLPMAQREAIGTELARRAEVELPADLMMSSEQVRALRRAGMQIGAHTVSHPILAKLDAAQAREEVGQGKRQLEALLGERVGLFAYPNGKPGEDYVRASVDVVREAGFDAAFSTAWGAASAASDLLQLPRFTPWERTPGRFGLRMLHNLRPQPLAALQVPQ